MDYTYKLGTHRGARRVWIEGKRLSAAGFKRGDAYRLTPAGTGFELVLGPAGDRHVAGTADRPIVDILTHVFAADVARVVVSFGEGRIRVAAE